MAIRHLLGTVACLNPNCGVEVPVKQGERGSVSASCPFCDLSVYAKEGSQAKRDLVALMKPAGGRDAPPAAPAAAPVPPAPPTGMDVKRAPSTPSTIFG